MDPRLWIQDMGKDEGASPWLSNAAPFGGCAIGVARASGLALRQVSSVHMGTLIEWSASGRCGPVFGKIAVVRNECSNTIASEPRPEVASPYVGVRMTADEFLEIPDDGLFYELIDGVVVVSPSPSPKHQHVAFVIATQLARFPESRSIGRAFMELDVHLGTRPAGGDLVYRPEVIFVPLEQLRRSEDRIVGAPPLVVEVISRGSHRIDTKTKRDDYERFGVREYWLIDPQREALLFLVNEGGGFVEADASGEAYASRAVPGFVLDVAAVRAAFKPW